MTSTKWYLVAVLALSVTTGAQIVAPSNYHVSLVANGINASGDSMEADIFDNVYIVDQANAIGTTPASVTRVDANGNVTPNHATGFGVVGQIAYNPSDGLVYLVEHSPLLTVLLSKVWRLDPAGGATFMFTVDVVAKGFTIDNQGRYYFGGVGTQGQGLYRATVAPIVGAVSATFLHPGHGQNSMLLSQIDGSVLIADGLQVKRWSQLAAGLTTYHTLNPLGNVLQQYVSMSRMPYNQLGAGALLGAKQFSTFTINGTGRAIPGDLQGAGNQNLFTEIFTPPFQGLLNICAAQKRRVFWYTDNGPNTTTTPGNKLLVIEELPDHNHDGSLMLNATPGQLQVDIYGPAGAPFLWGGVVPTVPAPDRFYAPFGVIDIDPFGIGYAPFIDGIGLFAPPNPLGICPFHATFFIPPILSGFEVLSQACPVAVGEAPNGLAYFSNVEHTVFP